MSVGCEKQQFIAGAAIHQMQMVRLATSEEKRSMGFSGAADVVVPASTEEKKVRRIHDEDMSNIRSSGVMLSFQHTHYKDDPYFPRFPGAPKELYQLTWMCGRCEFHNKEDFLPEQVARDEYGVKSIDVKCRQCGRLIQFEIGL